MNVRRALRWVSTVCGLALALSSIGCGNAPPATRDTLALRHAEDGDHAWRTGRYGAAAKRYERAIHHARARDDQALVASLLARQAAALAAAGGCKLALPRLAESATLHAQLGRESSAVWLLQGRCLAALGQPTAAAAALRRAQRSGKGCAQLEALAGLGALAAARDDLTAAAKHYDAAGRVACTDPGAKAQLAYNRGRLSQRRGLHSGAVSQLQAAVRGYRAAHDEGGLADALHALGASYAASKQGAAAADAYRRAGHAAWTAGRARAAAHAFALAAAQLTALGRTAEAARCQTHGREALSRAAAQRR